MKIAVIQNKYGEQINLHLPDNWTSFNIFCNGNFGDVTNDFINYFEKQTNKYTNDSQLYFEHVYYVDTYKDLINDHSYHCDICDDEFGELTDYPYIGIGTKPHNGKILTEEQLEKIVR